ncbi:MAG: PRC-barrel domain-containing protein [Bryobacterales bacterium]|nr:PRC-barrel domain-containing protein [Bryobacterales bacterium]
MLRSAKELLGYTLRASDGQIGSVQDLYFDDRAWTIRYIMAGTGGGLFRRRVLISPLSTRPIDARERCLPVTLSRAQVRESPEIGTAVTVLRQQEEALAQYYGWPPYWMDGPAASRMTAAAASGGPAQASPGEPVAAVEPSSHLRMIGELLRYRVHSGGDEIGHVLDFIIDDQDWHIRYMALDTGKWLPRRKVLVARDWIRNVSWADQVVTVDVSRDQILRSPVYNSAEALNREYETRLYNYYGRPKYWRD